MPSVVAGSEQLRLVIDGLPDLDRQLETTLRRCVTPPVRLENGERAQRPGGQPSVLRGCRQRVLEPPRGLRKRRPDRPEPAERPGELEVADGVVLSQEIERGAKVVVFLVEPLRPGRARIGPLGIGSLGESEVVLGVLTAHRVALAAFLEQLPGVLTDRLQHPEPLAGVPERDSCRRATAGCPGRPPRPARPPRVCSRRGRRRAW